MTENRIFLQHVLSVEVAVWSSHLVARENRLDGQTHGYVPYASVAGALPETQVSRVDVEYANITACRVHHRVVVGRADVEHFGETVVAERMTETQNSLRVYTMISVFVDFTSVAPCNTDCNGQRIIREKPPDKNPLQLKAIRV